MSISASTSAAEARNPPVLQNDFFTTLPTELKILVASCLSKPDLKSLSLASKIHTPIALRALNELEKNTAIRELRALSQLNPERLPVTRSLLGMYKSIVCRLRDENLLAMEQEQELTLHHHLQTLSTDQVASRFLMLNQTIARQIGENATFFDNIEIEYFNAKKAYVIDALKHLVAAATQPQLARELAVRISAEALQFDITQELLATGPISQEARGNLAVACSVITNNANFFQNVIRIQEISREDRGWVLRMVAMRPGTVALIRTVLESGPITESDIQSSLTNAENHENRANARMLQYYLENRRFNT